MLKFSSQSIVLFWLFCALPSICFAGSVRLKLPVYVEDKYFLSDSAYINVTGEGSTQDWKSMKGGSAEAKAIYRFLSSIDSDSFSGFKAQIDTENFAALGTPPDAYFDQFKRYWTIMGDQEVFSIISSDNFMLVVIRAKYKGQYAYPAAVFTWSSGVGYRLAVDLDNDNYRLLLSWVARLATDPSPFMSAAEHQAALKKGLYFHQSSPTTSEPTRTPGLGIYLPLRYEDNFPANLSKFFGAVEGAISKGGDESIAAQVEATKAFHNAPTYSFVKSMVAADPASAEAYLTRIAGFEPRSYVDFGEVVGVFGVEGSAENPILLYLETDGNSYRIANIERTDVLDQFLLSDEMIMQAISDEQ